jgi:hypothetical protein
MLNGLLEADLNLEDPENGDSVITGLFPLHIDSFELLRV